MSSTGPGEEPYRGQHDADMAQEAFLKAFRSLRSFRGESAFSTWLIAIALNSYRSRLRAEGPPLLTIDVARAIGVEPSALRGIQDEERTEAVRRAVLTLPARYRDALIVYYSQERDLSEASRILGIAEGTLKARLHRGRELLRRRCAVLAPQRSGPVPEGNMMSDELDGILILGRSPRALLGFR